jgi:hypothetical protein
LQRTSATKSAQSGRTQAYSCMSALRGEADLLTTQSGMVI